MISDKMNFSESSCSSFSLTDSESEREISTQNDCEQKRDENEEDKKEGIVDNGNTTVIEKEDIKKKANSTDESQKEGIKDSEQNKEKIVYR